MGDRHHVFVFLDRDRLQGFHPLIVETMLLGVFDVVPASRVELVEHPIHHCNVQRQQTIQKPLDVRNFIFQDLAGFCVDEPDAHLLFDVGDGDPLDLAVRDGVKERN